MSEFVPIQVLQAITDALNDVGVPFHIGGSVASVIHGLPRSTIDIDIVVDLGRYHVEHLVRRLGDDWYIDDQMARDAISRSASFNIIHLPTMYKVDLFIRKQRPFDIQAAGRAVRRAASPDDPREYPVASAEDVILNKLEWYRTGGEVSERQWLDVIGVMKVQRDQLDRPYMSRWAAELGVSDLLDRTWREAEGGGL